MAGHQLLANMALFLIAVSGVSGQEFRSSISGRLIDAQQAVVPSVQITATQLQTGARHETRSESDGQYTIPFLPPGAYRITAEVPGFKRYVREPLNITTNERVQLDIRLELGEVSESITVSAETSMLETATASTGQVINTRAIENMPMNGRTPLVLAQLAFGVNPNSDPRFSRPFDNSGPSDFSMGGAASRNNELLVDGSPDTTRNSRVAYSPPVDAVQEVKVETFQSDAAYGHTGGGTVNVVLKSGTNDFHGSAYDFNQVSRLAATPLFTNRSGQKKPGLIFNQYGINGGGPIFIPKVFNGRNRLFWYFAFEGIRDAFPEPLTSTVPTAAERQGDFSGLLKLGPQYQIYDPLSGVQEGSRVRRQPFANNVIAPERLNQVALKILPFYPLPNQSGPADGRDNFLANSVRTDSYSGELGRLDVNANNSHKFFFNFRHNDRVENRSNRFKNIATGNYLSRINWGSMLDDVYTFSPTTVLNTRLNWTRFIEANTRQGYGFDFSQLGMPNYLAAAASRLSFPRIDIANFTQLGDGAGDQTPFDIFQIFSSLTKVYGRHTLKFGGDLRLYRESQASYGDASGSYTFRPDLVRGPLDTSSSAPMGQDLASFLLGYPTGGDFDINAYRTDQSKYYSVFVQDDLRVRSNLTVNLGLRHERDLPTTERFNRITTGFAFDTASPIAAEAKTKYAQNPSPLLPVDQFNLRGGLLFADEAHRYGYQSNNGYFSPRFGIAWTPAGVGGKTVIRGGAGTFVYPMGVIDLQQPGFSQRTQLISTQDNGLTPYATLSNPFPQGLQFPAGSSSGLRTYLGQATRFYNLNPANPYSIRWTLNVQRGIGRGMVAEIGYVGNHSVHLRVDRQQDFVPRQYLSTLQLRDQPNIDRLTEPLSNPLIGLVGGSLNTDKIQVQQLLRPFPQFTEVRQDAMNDGSSYFHSLEGRFEKRFAAGLQALVNYQFSKLISYSNRLNDADPGLEKRVADEDHPHRFVASASYELPFRQSKLLAGGAGPVLNRIVGGWVINVIYSYQTGAAVDWGYNSPLRPSSSSHPDYVTYFGGDIGWNPRNVEHAFDTSRFSTASKDRPQYALRTFPSRFGSLRRDGMNNFDLSVLKDTRVAERAVLQYRAEFFNALNHPKFDAPQVIPTASNFGTITAVNNLERHVQMALRLSW